MALYDVIFDELEYMEDGTHIKIKAKDQDAMIVLNIDEFIAVYSVLSREGIAKSDSRDSVIIIENGKIRKLRGKSVESDKLKKYQNAVLLIPKDGQIILRKGITKLTLTPEFTKYISKELKKKWNSLVKDKIEFLERDPCTIIIRYCYRYDFEKGLCEVKYKDFDSTLYRALLKADSKGLILEKNEERYIIEDKGEDIDFGTYQLTPKNTKMGRQSIVIPLSKNITPTEMKKLIGFAYKAIDKKNISNKITESLVFKLHRDCLPTNN